MTATGLNGVAASRADRLAAWCGWVMVGAAVLIPPLAWLDRLGFAPLLVVMGLLCLPAFRITDEDRPVLIVLLGALVWAAVSTTWSPWRPKDFQRNGVLQLALALPIYWCAICGARRADPRLNALALRILGWGTALVGVVLLADVFAKGHIYQSLYQAVMGPIRLDLATGDLERTTFVVAVLWPAVLVGRLRRGWEAVALLAVAVVGQGVAAHAFFADAPVVAIPLCIAVMAVIWRWPTVGPRLMAVSVAIVFFVMPGLVWALRASGHYQQLEGDIDSTWGARLSYWSHTLDWIGDKPVRGWGLDASRAMGPGIVLHPHNGALQIWLELGLVGAVAAAAFWALSLIRLGRDRPSLAMTGLAGTVTAYLLFAWVSYGVWQAWWLALGALIPVLAAMLTNSSPAQPSSAARV